MTNRAWVTLATNDSYSLGALVLAHSLRRAGTEYPSVVLITPSVTDAMRERLSAVFAEVITVDVLDSRDAAHLALLQRPELGITFTKIHCWNLTQYEKCVFLDADTLVVQNCDELFEREELSAAPDVGWPDCFNSGVFVFKPSADTFSRLITFAKERGSFDGGDQGLLNSFFSDWAHGDISKHLPFLYNVTSAAFYSYIPALKHYGQNLKIIHFIGAAKPWLQQYNWDSNSVDAPDHIRGLLQLWWDIFVGQVHTQLDITMTGVAGNLARVVPGAASQGAVDELTRRQGWEAGNIDYMGADSFDNIWAKISQTLNQPRTSPPRQSPPKQPSPPKEQPAPEVEPSKEPAAPAVEPAPVAPSESKTEVSPPSVAPEPPKEDKKGEVVQTPVESKPVEVVPVKAEALAPVAAAVESAPAPPAPVAPAAAAPAPVDPVAVAPVESAPVAPAPIVAAAVEPTPVVAAPVEPAPTAAAPVVPPAAAPVEPASPAAPEPKKTPAPTEPPKETPVEQAKVVETQAPAEPEKPKPIEKAAEAVEVPVVPKSEAKVESAPKPAEATPKKTEIASVPPTPPVTPVKSTPEASTPVSEEAPKLESQVEKSVEVTASSTDSPPLANTPSKEEAPVVSAAKSTEEAAQETRL